MSFLNLSFILAFCCVFCTKHFVFIFAFLATRMRKNRIGKKQFSNWILFTFGSRLKLIARIQHFNHASHVRLKHRTWHWQMTQCDFNLCLQFQLAIFWTVLFINFCKILNSFRFKHTLNDFIVNFIEKCWIFGENMYWKNKINLK